MGNLTRENFVHTYKYRSYGFNDQISFTDYGNYAAVTDFEGVLEQAIPVTGNYSSETLDFYQQNGVINPEEVAPSQVIDETVKVLLNFREVLVKQLGLMASDFLNRQYQKGGELVQLITAAVNAILGISTGGFNFNVFSLIGNILSIAGFSNLGGLFSMLGGAKDNWKTMQKEEEKVAKEAGKNVTAAVQATQKVMDNAEGNSVNVSNVQQTDSNVVNTKANVSINEQTPMKSVAANTYVQTSTDHIVTSNFYKANHTYCSIQADNAFNISTRHSTRYHSASVVEIAAEADYVASSLSSYADFRWTQTGQGLISLPIANQLEGLLGQLFKTGNIPVTGVNVDLSTFAKLTTAKLFNLNHGMIYTIDGFVLINSGIGAGLASIPPRSISNITDIPVPTTVERTKPEPFVSVNNRTYETLYRNNEKFEGVNFGQIFTNVQTVADNLKEQTSQGFDSTQVNNNPNN